MKKREKETLADWVAYAVYSLIINLGAHPVRRYIWGDIYRSLTAWEEIAVFLCITVAVLFLIVRPFARKDHT